MSEGTLCTVHQALAARGSFWGERARHARTVFGHSVWRGTARGEPCEAPQGWLVTASHPRDKMTLRVEQFVPTSVEASIFNIASYRHHRLHRCIVEHHNCIVALHRCIVEHHCIVEAHHCIVASDR